jgi:PAS domain-containing protein
MAAPDRHHQALIKGVAKNWEFLLEKSRQAVYIYFDDVHKVCNQKFAKLLGYASPEEWQKNETPLDDVVEEDQDAVVAAFTQASEKLSASSLDVSVKNVKTGKPLKVNVIMAPIEFNLHIFVIHFITKKS